MKYDIGDVLIVTDNTLSKRVTRGLPVGTEVRVIDNVHHGTPGSAVTLDNKDYQCYACLRADAPAHIANTSQANGETWSWIVEEELTPAAPTDEELDAVYASFGVPRD